MEPQIVPTSAVVTTSSSVTTFVSLTKSPPVENCTSPDRVLDPADGRCKSPAEITGRECRKLTEQLSNLYQRADGSCDLLPNTTSEVKLAIAKVPQQEVRARILSGFAKSQSFDDVSQVRDFANLLSVQLPTGANASGQPVKQLRRTVGDLLGSVSEFAGKGLLASVDQQLPLAESRSLAHAASSVLAAVDNIGRGLQFAEPGFNATAPGIALSVQRLRPDGSQLVQSADQGSTIKLRLLAGSTNEPVAMVTTVLDLPHLTNRLASADRPVVSKVVQATLYSKGDRLDTPAGSNAEVLLLIPHNKHVDPDNLRQCVYLLNPANTSDHVAETELLSNAGCRVAAELSDSNVTACLCRHLSSFAVVVMPSITWFGIKTQRLWKIHSPWLTILTCVCLGASIICLLLTSLTYIVVRLQTPMADKSIATLHRVHRSLCLALMLGQALFLAAFQPPRGTSVIVCKLLSSVTLYALLCAFCWLLCEGLMYTHSLVIVLPRVDSAFAKVKFWHYCLASGLAPLLIVLPIIFLRHEQLIQTEPDISDDNSDVIKPTVCWLSGDRGVSFAFIGPAMTVCCVNLCLFAIIMRRLARSGRDNDPTGAASSSLDASIATKAGPVPRLAFLSRQMKVAATLSCLLGLTWLLGLVFLLAETHLFIAAQYAFTLLNGLQGCFIFASQVCAHRRVREDCEKFLINGRRTPGPLRRLLERRRNARLSAAGSGSTPANKAHLQQQQQQQQQQQPWFLPNQQQQQFYLPYEGDVRMLVDKSSESSSRLSRLLSVFRLGRSSARHQQQQQQQHRRGCRYQQQQPSDTVTGLSDLSPPRAVAAAIDCQCDIVDSRRRIKNNNNKRSSSSGVGSGGSAWFSGSSQQQQQQQQQQDKLAGNYIYHHKSGSSSGGFQPQAPLVTEENFTSTVEAEGCAGRRSVFLDARVVSSGGRRSHRQESGFFEREAFCDTRLDDQSLFDITHSLAEPALRSPTAKQQHQEPPPPPIETLPDRCPGSRELLYSAADEQDGGEYLVPDCTPAAV